MMSELITLCYDSIYIFSLPGLADRYMNELWSGGEWRSYDCEIVDVKFRVGGRDDKQTSQTGPQSGDTK